MGLSLRRKWSSCHFRAIHSAETSARKWAARSAGPQEKSRSRHWPLRPDYCLTRYRSDRQGWVDCETELRDCGDCKQQLRVQGYGYFTAHNIRIQYDAMYLNFLLFRHRWAGMSCRQWPSMRSIMLLRSPPFRKLFLNSWSVILNDACMYGGVRGLFH